MGVQWDHFQQKNLKEMDLLQLEFNMRQCQIKMFMDKTIVNDEYINLKAWQKNDRPSIEVNAFATLVI